jgi:hypothetical protein
VKVLVANRSLGCGGHCPRRKETRSAIDGPALRWIERNSCLLAALGAGHRHFNTLLDSRNLSGRYRRQAIILGLLARLAALWFVLQTLVVEKYLFAAGPNKRLVAIDASDRSILKVRRLFASFISIAVWHCGSLPCTCDAKGQARNLRRLYEEAAKN